MSRAVVAVMLIFVASAQVPFNRYIPGRSTTKRESKGFSPEVLASEGMDNRSLRRARDLIAEFYTADEPRSGIESDKIGDGMEEELGGYWMVAIFDSGYDMAYTITRRSKHYALFSVDEDHTILIAQENANPGRWERLHGQIPDHDGDDEKTDFRRS